MKKLMVLSLLSTFVLPTFSWSVNTPEAVAQETAPTIKIILSDVSAFHKGFVIKGKKIEMSPMASIKIEYDGVSPYGVKVEPIKVDEGTPREKTYNIENNQISSILFVPGTNIPERIVVDFTFPESLGEGKHIISFHARSLGIYAPAATAVEKLSVNVVGGPIRVLEKSLTYPSPYSVKRDKQVAIQYRLSEDAAVDIYIISGNATMMKRFSIEAGDEGGSAGLNKVIWDGVTDDGYQAGNGIYSGLIFDRDNNKLIGRFKLTVIN